MIAPLLLECIVGVDDRHEVAHVAADLHNEDGAAVDHRVGILVVGKLHRPAQHLIAYAHNQQWARVFDIGHHTWPAAFDLDGCLVTLALLGIATASVVFHPVPSHSRKDLAPSLAHPEAAGVVVLAAGCCRQEVHQWVT